MPSESLGSGEYFQVLTLTLSDGSKAEFTGRYQIPIDSEVRIVDVSVSHPQQMPSGAFFEEMKR